MTKRMSTLRILVVEDAANWQKALPQYLGQLGDGVQVEVAPNYSQALHYVTNNVYDLAIVDLALQLDDSDQGMDLLRDIRSSASNRGCAIIVLTAHSTPANVRQALRDYAVYDFLGKENFDERVFVETARATILDGRFREAERKASACYRLVITFNQEHLIGSELTGPNRHSIYIAEQAPRFQVADLVRRTDNLNLLILHGGAEMWRPEAHSIGSAIYQALTDERQILGDLVAGRALAQRSADLCVQFSGPAAGFSLPFELLRDERDYLGLHHILTRQLSGTSMSRKPEPFHQFLRNLHQRREPLRILVVGANSDGCIPSAEAEATALATRITAELTRLGVATEVTLLMGAEASYSNVRAALRDGRYHIFHYAGHGRSNDTLPEIGGLILNDDHDFRALTAADLSLLTRDTELRFVFLSCCLSARSADKLGRGDFHGVPEALTQADVPNILGYRWTVRDDQAMQLAQDFYQELWRTFSPGEALLQARCSLAIGKEGRDNETWASPILVTQNT